LRLTSILGGTAIHNLILEKYKNDDFIFAELPQGQQQHRAV